MIAKLESQKWHRSLIDLTLRWSMSKTSSAKKRIVTVQIGHDVAIDGGGFEAGIDSVGLAAVRFATPADLPTIRIQEIDGSVLRGAVLNMIRKGRIILPQNARDGCFQIFALVVARRYDCDPG